MLNFSMVSQHLEETFDFYCQQCSIMVNARDLATISVTLANGGVNPITKERAIDEPYVQDLISVMFTCGMYDYSGEWTYRVGIPAKSGVSGGISAVVPGTLGIGTFSPLLDDIANHFVIPIPNFDQTMITRLQKTSALTFSTWSTLNLE